MLLSVEVLGCFVTTFLPPQVGDGYRFDCIAAFPVHMTQREECLDYVIKGLQAWTNSGNTASCSGLLSEFSKPVSVGMFLLVL